MGRTVPIVLYNCTIRLWHVDSQGNPSGQQLLGSRVENAALRGLIQEIESTASGAETDEYEQLGEEHEIRIGRIFTIDVASGRSYRLERGKYALTIYGEDPVTGLWHRRTYLGVTAKSNDIQSQGILTLMEGQVFRARRMLVTHGQVEPGEASPTGLDPSAGVIEVLPEEEPVSFTHHGPMPVDDYFMEVYRFGEARRVVWAKVYARAGQDTATVIELEAGGVLTGVQLTIPAGALNEEVSAEDNFEVDLAANAGLRWKVISGPADVMKLGWMACVTMNLRKIVS